MPPLLLVLGFITGLIVLISIGVDAMRYRQKTADEAALKQRSEKFSRDLEAEKKAEADRVAKLTPEERSTEREARLQKFVAQTKKLLLAGYVQAWPGWTTGDPFSHMEMIQILSDDDPSMTKEKREEGWICMKSSDGVRLRCLPKPYVDVLYMFPDDDRVQSYRIHLRKTKLQLV